MTQKGVNSLKMGWNCLAHKSYQLRDHFLLVARPDQTTGSRNIKPEVVFKVQKMARYALFCLIMDPFKGEVPVFTRLWPVRVRVSIIDFPSLGITYNGGWCSATMTR